MAENVKVAKEIKPGTIGKLQYEVDVQGDKRSNYTMQTMMTEFAQAPAALTPISSQKKMVTIDKVESDLGVADMEGDDDQVKIEKKVASGAANFATPK